MSWIWLIAAIVILGLVYYLIEQVPIDAAFKNIARIVLIIIAIVLVVGWLVPALSGFGFPT